MENIILLLLIILALFPSAWRAVPEDLGSDDTVSEDELLRFDEGES